MPKQGEPMVHFSLFVVDINNRPGPTVGNYETIEEAADAWELMDVEVGETLLIARIFSEFDATSQIYEIKRMEFISPEEFEKIERNELSDTTVDDIMEQMNQEEVFSGFDDEHPDWPITEFHAIVNYEKALDERGLEVPPISTHETLAESKEEYSKKGYTPDYVIVVRQVKTNPEDPNDSYLFDEWDVE